MGTPSYVWDDTKSTVTINNVGTPSTVAWATLRSQDRAAIKSHALTAVYSSALLPLPPNLPVRPLDDIALRLKVEITNFVSGATMTLTGTDWRGATLSEDIVITGNGIYQTTNYFRTLTEISDDGIGDYEFQVWQDRWGIFGYNPGYPMIGVGAVAKNYVLQGGVIVGNGVIFVPHAIILRDYKLTMRIVPEEQGVLEPDNYTRADSGGVVNFGKVENLAKKTVSQGTQITILTKLAYSLMPFEILNNGGTIGFYGSSISCEPGCRLRSLASSVTRLWGANMGIIGVSGEGYDFSNLVETGGTYFIDGSATSFAGAGDRLTLLSVGNIIYAAYPLGSGEITLSNIYSRGHTFVFNDPFVFTIPYSATIHFLNADFDSWLFKFSSYWTGKTWRHCELDAFCEDEDGNPLEGVSAVGEYADESEAFPAVESDVNGNIPTQTVDYGWYEYATGNTVNLKTPLKVTYTKAGYQTLPKYYPMAEKTKDTVKMQKVVDLIFVNGKPVLNLSEKDPKNELYMEL